MCTKSSALFAWKLAENHSRASRKRGSRRSSNSRNIKLACSFVTSPMLPPLVWIVGLFFAETKRTDFRPRWARKLTELERQASADRPRAARDGDSYDS